MSSANTPHFISTLNPLRGIAAILIVFYHCNFEVQPFLLGYTKLLQNAALFFDFFFVLSGFIMYHVYHQNFTGGTRWQHYKAFLSARFARIYPLHFVTTLVAFALCAIILYTASDIDPGSAGHYNLPALPSCLLLINGFPIFENYPLNVPSWSLSLEWWMYLVFPFLVPLFAGFRKTGRVLMMLVIILLYCTVVFYGPHNEIYNNWLFAKIGFLAPYSAISKCVTGFISGMLLYRFFQTGTAREIMQRDAFFVAAAAASLLALHFGMMQLIAIICFALVILAAAVNTGRIKQMLDSSLLQRLGNWSFSIYMIHFLVIYLYFIIRLHGDAGFLRDSIFIKEEHFAQGAAVCAAILAVTLLLSAFSWRYIEIPCRNFLNKRLNSGYANAGLQKH